ncbi:MAG: hypothetical protein M1819_006254 [Sarea resinae]|nr:MAG: hypothetical protein M1819_006254 [Sarea resinae]
MGSRDVSGGDFHIYQDRSALPTPDPDVNHSLDDDFGTPRNGDTNSDVENHPTRGRMMQSIEHDDPIEKTGPRNSGSIIHHRNLSNDATAFEDDNSRASLGTAPESDDDISEMPEDVGDAAIVYEGKSSPYTPLKQRPPFRNPSSVRAMQLETTPPPFQNFSSPLSQRYKHNTPSRSGTPRSIRSQSAMKTKLSPSKKKEYPLVLLHVTILPIAFHYSLDVMEAVLPPYVIDNYNLLKDKISDTVLERGILLPHPREDYELLEERLLESLELKLPRILKCGHFHRDDEASHGESDVEDGYHTEDEDAEICVDCGGRVKDGRFGCGSGSRRWDIKIYAANGLMRAGAWAAAWSEMERVDVELAPWVSEEMRRELDLRKEEEELEASRKEEDDVEDVDVDVEEEERMLKEQEEERLFKEQEELRIKEEAQARREKELREAEALHQRRSEMEARRLREIYGESQNPASTPPSRQPPPPPPPQPAEPATEPAFVDPATNPTMSHRPTSRSSKRASTTTTATSMDPAQQIPLLTLLQNYVYLLSQDKRNIVILLLSSLIVFLALRPTTPPPAVGGLGQVDRGMGMGMVVDYVRDGPQMAPASPLSGVVSPGSGSGSGSGGAGAGRPRVKSGGGVPAACVSLHSQSPSHIPLSPSLSPESKQHQQSPDDKIHKRAAPAPLSSKVVESVDTHSSPDDNNDDVVIGGETESESLVHGDASTESLVDDVHEEGENSAGVDVGEPEEAVGDE